MNLNIIEQELVKYKINSKIMKKEKQILSELIKDFEVIKYAEIIRLKNQYGIILLTDISIYFVSVIGTSVSTLVLPFSKIKTINIFKSVFNFDIQIIDFQNEMLKFKGKQNLGYNLKVLFDNKKNLEDINVVYFNTYYDPRFKKSNYKILKIIFLIIVFIMILSPILEKLSNNIPKVKNDKIITENISKSLNAVGLKNDEYELSRDTMLDDLAGEGTIGYRAKTDFSKLGVVVYLNKDLTVHSVRWADKDYYINNEVKRKITLDAITSIEEKSRYVSYIQEIVKSKLISPKSAKFPWDFDEWNLSKKNGIVKSRSYVDSKNAFGVEIRTYFTATIDTKTNTLIRLKFD